MNPPALQEIAGNADMAAAALRLAVEGAIMTVYNSPGGSYLVGSLRWAADGAPRVLFFAANGDGVEDGHELCFDTVEPADTGLRFFHGGKIVGTLLPIDAAAVDDPDDYRVGWSIWQQVAPLKQRFVSALFDRLENQARSMDGTPGAILARDARLS
jgi:hypothetical protein